MNIVIHRYSAKKLEQIFEELCRRLDIPYKYDKHRHFRHQAYGKFA